jgi:hypothetical protein
MSTVDKISALSTNGNDEPLNADAARISSIKLEKGEKEYYYQVRRSNERQM